MPRTRRWSDTGRDEQGSVLLASLVIIFVTTMLGLALYKLGVVESRLVYTSQGDARVFEIAQTGVERAIFNLQNTFNSDGRSWVAPSSTTLCSGGGHAGCSDSQFYPAATSYISSSSVNFDSGSYAIEFKQVTAQTLSIPCKTDTGITSDVDATKKICDDLIFVRVTGTLTPSAAAPDTAPGYTAKRTIQLLAQATLVPGTCLICGGLTGAAGTGSPINGNVMIAGSIQIGGQQGTASLTMGGGAGQTNSYARLDATSLARIPPLPLVCPFGTTCSGTSGLVESLGATLKVKLPTNVPAVTLSGSAALGQNGNQTYTADSTRKGKGPLDAILVADGCVMPCTDNFTGVTLNSNVFVDDNNITKPYQGPTAPFPLLTGAWQVFGVPYDHLACPAGSSCTAPTTPPTAPSGTSEFFVSRAANVMDSTNCTDTVDTAALPFAAPFSVTNQIKGGPNTTTLTVGSLNVQVGDLVFVTMADQVGGSAPTIADNLDANPWTAGTTTNNTVRLSAWWKKATTAGSLTATLTTTVSSNAARAAIMQVWNGANFKTIGAAPVDQNPAALSGSSSPYTSNLSGTLAQEHELVVSYFGLAAPGADVVAVTPPAAILSDPRLAQATVVGTTGGTLISNALVALGFDVVSQTTSISRSATDTTNPSSPGVAGIATFKIVGSCDPLRFSLGSINRATGVPDPTVALADATPEFSTTVRFYNQSNLYMKARTCWDRPKVRTPFCVANPTNPSCPLPPKTLEFGGAICERVVSLAGVGPANCASPPAGIPNPTAPTCDTLGEFDSRRTTPSWQIPVGTPDQQGAPATSAYPLFLYLPSTTPATTGFNVQRVGGPTDYNYRGSAIVVTNGLVQMEERWQTCQTPVATSPNPPTPCQSHQFTADSSLTVMTWGGTGCTGCGNMNLAKSTSSVDRIMGLFYAGCDPSDSACATSKGMLTSQKQTNVVGTALGYRLCFAGGSAPCSSGGNVPSFFQVIPDKDNLIATVSVPGSGSFTVLSVSRYWVECKRTLSADGSYQALPTGLCPYTP